MDINIIDSPKFKAPPSFRRRFETTTNSDGESETDILPRYTSLKDIMLSSSSPKHATASNNDLGNNISIRNELVKHAASAYVLSATIMIDPSNTAQDWFPYQLCEEVKNISCVDLQSCWDNIHVRLPLEALCRPVIELFYKVVHRMRNGLRDKEEIIT